MLCRILESKLEGSMILNRHTLWLQCRPEAEKPQLRLFCLPHAGSGASAFNSWNTSLPTSVQVCSILLPGRESRLSEPLYNHINPLLDDMTLALSPWLDIPFAIFGHSMGALLAFEWARRLQRNVLAQPIGLYLSGRRAPNVHDTNASLQTLTDREFMVELARRYDGFPQEFFHNAELMEVYLPILRADIAVVESYHFQNGEPLNCPISVFAGIRDTTINWHQLLAWKTQTRGRFALRFFPGGHFYPQPPMLKSISASLAEFCS